MDLSSPSDAPERPWLFKKGVSGNPGGKPKRLREVARVELAPPRDVTRGAIATLARSYAPMAIEELARIVREGKSERFRIMAAEALLDRALGKPKVSIAADVDLGVPQITRVERVVIFPDGTARPAPALMEDGGGS